MRDLQIDDFVLEPAAPRISRVLRSSCYTIPFSKACHTFLELASRFKLRVRDGYNIDGRKGMAQKRTQVFGEGAKGIIAPLVEDISGSVVE